MTGSLPTMMRAIDPSETGGPEVLALVERRVPFPGPEEVLIRVAAAGVNRPDVIQRLGAYPPPPGAPSIPGLEVSGEIVALGEAVESLTVGEKVCALVPGGGYAEFVSAPAGSCLPVPEGLSLVDAAGLPETYFTVWSNLFERAGVRDGETALIHGGTSGIGTTATQLCRAIGVIAITTNGSDEKCTASQEWGADHAINYKTADFVEEVERLTDGRGVDVVLDMVGGDYLPRNMKCLAAGGRHISIAVQRGASAEIPIWLIMQKRLHLTGSTLRPRGTEFKALIADALQENVWPLFAEGKLRPVTDRLLPLEKAAEAHRIMEAGEHVGKIILTT